MLKKFAVATLGITMAVAASSAALADVPEGAGKYSTDGYAWEGDRVVRTAPAGYWNGGGYNGGYYGNRGWNGGNNGYYNGGGYRYFYRSWSYRTYRSW